MQKFCIPIFLVLGMLFGLACGPAFVQDPVPPKLAFSDELFDVLQLPSAPEDTSNGDQDTKCSIIMDSRIASSNGSSGYLKKNCYTFSQILACMKTSIAGVKYEGYYTGYDVEQQFNADTQTNTSVIVSNYIKTDEFFAHAVSAGFPNTDMLPSKAIEQIAEDADRDSLYIFITDMAMPRSSESYKIIEALSDEIISDNDLTVGLIGVLADYAGTVYNIPISHLGVNLPANESYQKPIYLLYVGEKKAVFRAMDNFLLASESNSSLNAPGQIRALYYYKYDCEPYSDAQAAGERQQTMAVSYSGRLTSYMMSDKRQQYDPEYIFARIPDDPEVNALVNSMPLSKVYSGVLADENIENEKDNLAFSFEIPFRIVSDTGSAKSGLLQSGGSIELSDLALSLAVDVTCVKLRKEDDALQMNKPESVSKEMNLHTDTANFDLDNATVSVLGDYNASGLTLDEPVIYLARMAVECVLPANVLTKAYDVSWLNDWQIDLTQLQKEWGRDTAIEQVLKTPYIADIFGKALLDANITLVQRYVSENDAQYVQGIDFGFVLREQAQNYSNLKDFEDNEDLGWAFSRADVIKMMSSQSAAPSPKP